MSDERPTPVPAPPPLIPITVLVREGDIVVARERDSAVYTVRQAPGVPQVRHDSRQAATELAARFAREQGVDLWVCEEGACVREMAFRSSHRRSTMGA